MKPMLSHQHSGRLAEHHHTSFVGLIFLLILVIIVLAALSQKISAESSGGGQSGVYASVAAPRPSTAPTVNVPASATALPVAATGNCQSDTLVKVFKNGVFAGATFCNGGSYSLPIGLFFGSNSITAASYNSLDQSGPVSSASSVSYNPPGVTLPASAGTFSASSLPANQPVLLSNIFYKGFQVGQEANWPLEIRGGNPPYAISISWGDGTTELISRPTDGTIPVAHIYKAAGGAHSSYDVVVKLTDAKGLSAYLQFVAVVAGNASAAPTASLPTGLALAWPIAAAALLAVASFWLGEACEKRVLAGSRV